MDLSTKNVFLTWGCTEKKHAPNIPVSRAYKACIVSGSTSKSQTRDDDFIIRYASAQMASKGLAIHLCFLCFCSGFIVFCAYRIFQQKIAPNNIEHKSLKIAQLLMKKGLSHYPGIVSVAVNTGLRFSIVEISALLSSIGSDGKLSLVVIERNYIGIFIAQMVYLYLKGRKHTNRVTTFLPV